MNHNYSVVEGMKIDGSKKNFQPIDLDQIVTQLAVNFVYCNQTIGVQKNQQTVNEQYLFYNFMSHIIIKISFIDLQPYSK